MERMLQISSKYLSLYGITILFWPAASGALSHVPPAVWHGVDGALSANAHWFDFRYEVVGEVVLSFFKFQKLIIIVHIELNLRISFGKYQLFGH